MAEDIVIYVERKPITQCNFDELYQKQKDDKPLKERLIQKLDCSGYLLDCFKNWSLLQACKTKISLQADFLAGVMTGIFSIPHALAFGMLSSLRVENGLYTSIWPCLIYAVFGRSKHLSVGTSAVISIIIANILNRQTENSLFQTSAFNLNSSLNETLDNMQNLTYYKENISSSVSFITGMILMLLGLFQFGFIVHLLSEPFLNAFTSGAAIHIIVSQVPLLLGMQIKCHGGIMTVGYTLGDILINFEKVNTPTIVVSVISISSLFIIEQFINKTLKQKLLIPIPAELCIIIIAVIVSNAASLHKELNVIGEIVSTIPEPSVPDMTGFQSYILDCFMIAFIIHATNMSLIKLLTKEHNYVKENEKDIFAYGLSCFGGAFFQCLPASVSYPRSKILSLMNVKSTLAGLFVAIFMLVTLTISHYVFEYLPKACLSAIVFFSVKGLCYQMRHARKFWYVAKFEFFIWISTFLAVIFLDLRYGFLVGVVLSLVAIIVQTQLSHGHRIGTIGDSILVEHKKYKNTTEIEGVKIFKFNSNLYFANALRFKESLYRKTASPPKMAKYIKRLERIKKKMMNSKLEKADTKEELRHDSIESIADSLSSNRTIQYSHSTLEDRKFSKGSTDPIISVLSVNEFGEELDDEDGQYYITMKKFEKMRKVHHVIIDCSNINYIDITGANILQRIFKEFKRHDITLFMAGCCWDVRKILMAAGTMDHIPAENIFISLHDALVVAKLSPYTTKPEDVAKDGKY